MGLNSSGKEQDECWCWRSRSNWMSKEQPAVLRSVKRRVYLQSLLQLMSVHLDTKCRREDRKYRKKSHLPVLLFQFDWQLNKPDQNFVFMVFVFTVVYLFQADDVVCMFCNITMHSHCKLSPNHCLKAVYRRCHFVLEKS